MGGRVDPWLRGNPSHQGHHTGARQTAVPLPVTAPVYAPPNVRAPSPRPRPRRASPAAAPAGTRSASMPPVLTDGSIELKVNMEDLLRDWVESNAREGIHSETVARFPQQLGHGSQSPGRHAAH